MGGLEILLGGGIVFTGWGRGVGGGITLGIILIFQSFCDAQLNIPYILKISLLKLVSNPNLA